MYGYVLRHFNIWITHLKKKIIIKLVPVKLIYDKRFIVHVSDRST